MPLPRKAIILLIGAVLLLSGKISAQVEVTLIVKGFRNNNGDLLMGVFNDPGQFPYDPFLEFAWPKDTLNGDQMVLTFTLPEKGFYACSVLDDENSSGGMDKNFIGVPKEYFGFTNDARPGLFSPPSYKDCLVEIKESRNKLTIKLKK